MLKIRYALLLFSMSMVLSILVISSAHATTLPNCDGTATLDSNIEDGIDVPAGQCAVLDVNIGTITGKVELFVNSQLTIYGDISQLDNDINIYAGATLIIHGDISNILGKINVFSGSTLTITGNIIGTKDIRIEAGGSANLDGANIQMASGIRIDDNTGHIDFKNGSIVSVTDPLSEFRNDGTASTITSDDSGNNIVTTIFAGPTGPFTCSGGACSDTSGVTKGVTITESDGKTITFETGISDDVGFVLDDAPTASVTINLSSSNSAEMTVSPASITFTTGNWNVAQTVTLTGVDDAVLDGTKQIFLVTSNSTSSDGGYNNMVVADVVVLNRDNGTNGGSTYDEPSIITNSTDPAEIFSWTDPATWEDMVAPGPDYAVTGSDIIIGGYVRVYKDSLTSLSKELVFAQNSSQYTMTIQSGATLVVENSLIFQQSATNLVIEAGGRLVVLGNFINDANHAVVNNGVMAVAENYYQQDGTVSYSGSGNLYVDGIVTPVSSNADTNDQPISNLTDGLGHDDAHVDQLLLAYLNDIAITESGGSTVTGENGTSDSFSVQLTKQPSTNVVLDISSSNSAEVQVTPSTLTFTNGNWNVDQTINLSGQDDDLVDGDGISTITVAVNTASSDGNYEFTDQKELLVTNSDDEIAAFTASVISGSTSEAGGTATFTVVLGARPLTDVVFDVVSNDEGEGTVSTGQLTFTNLNWNTAQAVTVMGVDDEVLDGAQSFDVDVTVNAAMSDDAFDALATQAVTVSNTDDEIANFIVSDISDDTDESGKTATFTVVLDAQPLTDVVLDVISGDTGEGTVDKSTLTFTNANWDNPQTVTVSGVGDGISDGDQTYDITVSIDQLNSDDAFDALADQQVSVTNLDLNTPGFRVNVTELTVVEGDTAIFTVKLSSEPTGNVQIDLNDAGTTLLELPFNATNWYGGWVVKLSLPEDDVRLTYSDIILTLKISKPNTYSAYKNLPDQTITLSIIDNDFFSVTETAGTTITAEDGTSNDAFDVVLNTAPTGDVVLAVKSNAPAEAAVSLDTLTFTSGNWNVPQTINVLGQDDNLVDGDSTFNVVVSLVPSKSDSAFHIAEDRLVAVTNTDDDVVGFVLSTTTVSAAEGLTTTFTISLTAEPNSNVTIDVSSDDAGAASVDIASISFDNTNWSTPQTITVTGEEDVDATDESVLITATINDATSDDNFDGLVVQTVTATITDNDVASFTVTETSGSSIVVESGTTDSFDVVLDAQPGGNVTINVTADDGTELSVDKTSIVFT
ncbi:MAG: hypothetical protein ABJ004_00925, partial [Cyclobacteriaceae bacterium]